MQIAMNMKIASQITKFYFLLFIFLLVTFDPSLLDIDHLFDSYDDLNSFPDDYSNSSLSRHLSTGTNHRKKTDR
jgi:hypothetical protein